MKKLLTILVSVVMLAAFVAGCAAPAATPAPAEEPAAEAPAAEEPAAEEPAAEEPAASGESWKIGFCVNNLTNPFRVAEFAQVEDWFAEHPDCELVYTAADNDVTKQIADMEDLIAQGCDLIFINCINEEAMTPTLELAKEKGVQVVAWDRNIANTDLRLASFKLDNYNDFKEYANRVVKAFEGKENAKIYLIMGFPGNAVTIDREGGLRDGLAESGATNIEIVGCDYASNNRAEAIELVESVILANPDLSAICCEVDEMALGVIQVLKANDMAGKILVFGNDGQKEGLEAIKEGNLQFTIKAPVAPFLAVTALDEIYGYLTTGSFSDGMQEDNVFYAATYYVDASNVDTYYDPDSPF